MSGPDVGLMSEAQVVVSNDLHHAHTDDSSLSDQSSRTIELYTSFGAVLHKSGCFKLQLRNLQLLAREHCLSCNTTVQTLSSMTCIGAIPCILHCSSQFFPSIARCGVQRNLTCFST